MSPPDRWRYPTLSDEEFRILFRPDQLPPQPWRYTLTPTLVLHLTNLSHLAGQLCAAPVSYYRQREMAARAKRLRIHALVRERHPEVTVEEIDSVLRGARLPATRVRASEAIDRAVLNEDACAYYTAAKTGSRRVTPATVMVYLQCRSDSRLPGTRPPPGSLWSKAPRWRLFSHREQSQLLEAQRTSVDVPSDVRSLVAWADADPLVSSSPVLRAATWFWAMTLLHPDWRAVGVLIRHELFVGGLDPEGLLVLSGESAAEQALLDVSSRRMLDADGGDLTGYFEVFASDLAKVVGERLRELGRVRDNEEHLPWRVVAPPDELDARLYEVVERLGQGGSAAIVTALGEPSPPLRTVQRRLQKLVADGTFAKRGARKNAVYSLPAADAAT